MSSVVNIICWSFHRKTLCECLTVVRGGAEVGVLALSPKRRRYSTGPERVAPNQCGVRVSSSTVLPALSNRPGVPKNKTQGSVEYISPVVALVGAQVGHDVIATGREDEFIGLNAARASREGNGDRAVGRRQWA